MSTTQVKLGETTATTTTDADTTTDAEDEQDDARSVRQRVIDAVGNDGDLGDHEVENSVVDDSRTVMWFPESVPEPIGIDVDVFTESNTEWEVGYTEVNDETEAVFGITNGDVTHIINADKVHAVAFELGVKPRDLLETAEINPAERDFPVLFEMDEGRMMIAPVMTEWDEVRPTRDGEKCL